MLSTSVLLAEAKIIWKLMTYGIDFNPFWTSIIEISKYLQEKKMKNILPHYIVRVQVTRQG